MVDSREESGNPLGSAGEPTLRHVEKEVLIPKMMREKARELCSDKVQESTELEAGLLAYGELVSKGLEHLINGKVIEQNQQPHFVLYQVLSRYRFSDGGQMPRGKCCTERMSYWLLY
ncbi:COX assembly mitochondrial protein homolog isoform X4 [Sceloporus undulatus]|uniref:COX assembly mitochondrial protein homolog isoform X4 n=1 Tax=Sceloporus undulatus TaxID=8520 RepID=UPI001C4DCB4F|nr:COX assembly mitochondrial protein homolog isoform X4 [Sceloporus undulatus]